MTFLILVEAAVITLLTQAGFAAQQEGIAARYDMLVLREVFEVEKAEQRLSLPAVEPILDEEGNVTNQAEIDADAAERAAAQESIDVADDEVMGWVEARRPSEALHIFSPPTDSDTGGMSLSATPP